MSSAGDDTLAFALRGWAAWAPGRGTPAAWQAWALGETTATSPDPAETAPAAATPPLLRRRATALGRMALEVLERLPPAPDAPIVFGSRHGELSRTVQLLRELAAEGTVSPQGFSMAVHNAIPGLHTIARGEHVNVVALSGGRANAGYALLEAALLLQDGADAVRVVMCDDALPAVYAPFADEPQQAHAVGLLLARGRGWRLGWNGLIEDRAPPEPSALALLRVVLGGADTLRFAGTRPGFVLQREPG